MSTATYTTQLQAGLGMLDETRELLQLWERSMSVTQLYQAALESGRFHSLSARRLRNIVAECFAPRYLMPDCQPALILKRLADTLTGNEFRQICLVYTCRANTIVADFIREVYWAAYAAGRNEISNQLARDFVEQANRDGRTTSPWSETTVKRVAGYLTGTLADYGMLQPAARGDRELIPFRLEARAAGIVAYDIHFQGRPDSQVISSTDWCHFGLDRPEVTELIKRLSMQNWFVYQAAGDSVRLSWRYSNVEELTDAICNGKL